MLSVAFTKTALELVSLEIKFTYCPASPAPPAVAPANPASLALCD